MDWRSRLRSITVERHRRRLAVGWGSLIVIELLLRSSDLASIAWSTWAFEIVALAVIGVGHAALAPDDWRGSAGWPGSLATLSVVVRIVFAFTSLSFNVVLLLVPFAAIGGAVLIAWGLRLSHRLVRRVPAVLLSAGGPLLVQLVLVGPAQTVSPFLPTPAPTSDGAPVVILSIDTLRSDAVEDMQTWKRLGARGATWPRAMAAASWTWPSIVTLWSGVSADEHRSGRRETRTISWQRWSDELPWLPSQVREAGYTATAFATNPVIALMQIGNTFDRWTYGNVVRIPLIVAGFPGGHYDGGDAEDVVDAAIDWLDDAPDSGWLLWVHLYEPHLPYPHATGTKWDFNLLRATRVGDWHMLEESREEVRRGYREQVAYADQHTARLLDTLEARKFFDRGVLVFTSDHGEELWDHDGFEHGHSHHGEVLDVPLALVAPGVQPGQRPGLAALEDVANTVRASIGLSHEGIDLRKAIPETRVARARGNAYFRPMRSARVGTTRVIVDGKRIDVYDLVADPKEMNPQRIDEAKLKSLVGEAGTPLEGGESIDLEGDALKALGYVH